MKNVENFKKARKLINEINLIKDIRILKLSVKCFSNINDKLAKEIKFGNVSESKDEESRVLDKMNKENMKHNDLENKESEKNLKIFKEASRKHSILNSKTYLASRNPIVINSDYEVLLFHHKISTFKATMLCMKYIVPISVLYYLIKTNPFYMSFPVMLPIMTFSLCFYVVGFIRYISSLQKIVEEIWLDRTGAEIKVSYRNKRYRKFRGNSGAEILLNDSLVSPAENEYKFLKGDIFPKTWPPAEKDFMNIKYFWHKYYLSKKNYFLLAKKATYLDYELLVNVFNGKNINLSQATTLLIDSDSMSYKEFKKTLSQIDETKQSEMSKLIKAASQVNPVNQAK